MEKAEASFTQELDSEGARADFENVLQVMVEKANAPESLPSTQSDQSDEKEIIPTDIVKQCPSPSKPRKRRRKDNSRDERQKNTYIIKLFDRSVDLARFPADTSLYPVCRAWMRNDPCRRNALKRINYLDRYKASKADDTNRNNSDDEDVTMNALTEIPTADKPWNNMTEDGRYVSPRIPAPIQRQHQNSIDDYLVRKTQAQAPEFLLLEHLEHWRNVREKWRLKSVENEGRYETGMNKLQQIYQRNALNQCSQQSNIHHH